MSISSPEDSITLILWYRGDRKSAPIYSVDARSSGNLENAKHHSADLLKNRIKFELNSNSIKNIVTPEVTSKSSSKNSNNPTSSTSRAYLTLDPVLMEDEAVYLCRVDFKWSRTMNTVTNLTVVCKYWIYTFLLYLFTPLNILFYTFLCFLNWIWFFTWILIWFFSFYFCCSFSIIWISWIWLLPVTWLHRIFLPVWLFSQFKPLGFSLRLFFFFPFFVLLNCPKDEICGFFLFLIEMEFRRLCLYLRRRRRNKFFSSSSSTSTSVEI